MKVEAVLVQNVRWPGAPIVASASLADSKDYYAVSDVIEIEFAMLPPEQQNANRALKETSEREALLARLAELDGGAA